MTTKRNVWGQTKGSHLLLGRLLSMGLVLSGVGCGDAPEPPFEDKPVPVQETTVPAAPTREENLQSVVQAAYEELSHRFPEGSLQVRAQVRTELLDPRESWSATEKYIQAPSEDVYFHPEQDPTTSRMKVERSPLRRVYFEYEPGSAMTGFALVGIDLTVGAEHFTYDAMLVRQNTAEAGCTFALMDPLLPMPRLPDALFKLYPGCGPFGQKIPSALDGQATSGRVGSLATGGNCPSFPAYTAAFSSQSDILCGAPGCAVYWTHSGSASAQVFCSESNRSRETTPGSGLFRRKKDCSASIQYNNQIYISGPTQMPLGCSLPRDCNPRDYGQDAPANIAGATLTEEDPVWGSWPRGGHVSVDIRASAFKYVSSYKRSGWSFKGSCGGKYDSPNHSADVNAGLDWTWERKEEFNQREIANAISSQASSMACTPYNSEECVDTCSPGQNRCSGDTVQSCQQGSGLCFNFKNDTDCAASGKVCQNGGCVDKPDAGSDGGSSTDGGRDGGPGTDGGRDGGPGTDGGYDGGSGTDGGRDGGPGTDGGRDGGPGLDGGSDGGCGDGGSDGGCGGDGGSDGGDGGSDGGPTRRDASVEYTDAAVIIRE